MNISLRQLQVFQAVAATRNFSRAGERVGLSQPAVSRAIREMEDQLGLRLFDRTTREVVVTEAGRILGSHLDRLLDELDLALQDVQGLVRQRRGRVRVASSPTLSASLLPACISCCTRDMPGVDIVLLDRIQQDVLNSVRNGEVDFGVVIDPAAADDLRCETILREPFQLVCPAAHPLARHRRVAWSALSGHPLVLLDHASGSRRLIDDALARHAARCAVVQEVGHSATVFRMVEAGIGVTVLPTLALAPAVPHGLAARLLTPPVERNVMLVHRHNRTLAPLAQQVWSLVRGVAHAMAATRSQKAAGSSSD